MTSFARSAAVAIVVLAAATAHGLDHSGTCSGTFSPNDNPHRLVGFCSVPDGQTLTLLPGVILNGQSNQLQVAAGATLTAIGTSSAQRNVQFIDVHLRFLGPSAGGGTLRHCTMTGGGSQLNITDASPTVEACTFSGMSSAIALSGSSLGMPAQPMLIGNLITASVGIQVSGTARPTVTGNMITTTNNVGIDYSGDAAGTASGNVIAFLSEGGSNRRGIEVTGNARPVINGNEIQDDPARSDQGLIVQVNAGVAVQVTNNVVRASGQDRAMDLGINTFVPGPTITGNTFPTGVGMGFGLNGTLTESATIGALQGQQIYRMSFVAVQAPATLTIAPGITLDGQGNQLQVAAGATLTAIGTSSAQRNVQFTDVHLRFLGSSVGGGTLRHCTMTGGGSQLQITDASPTVEACTFSGMSTAIAVGGSSQAMAAQPMLIGNLITGSVGIQVSGTARPTVTGSMITTTNNVGIDYSGDAAGTASGNVIAFLSEGGSNRRGIEVTGNARPVINGNEIQDDPSRSDQGLAVQVNAEVAVQVTNNVVRASGQDRAMELGINTFVPGPTISGNTFPTGVGNGFGLSGTLTQSATIGAIQGQQIYRMSFVAVQAPATLTIAPGITLDGQGNQLQVAAGATLTAIGTSSAQRNVQFTDVHLRFLGSSAGGGTLRHCTMTGGGSQLQITDASPTVEACTFSGMSTAIAVGGSSQAMAAQPMLMGNLITGSIGIQVSGTARPTVTGNMVTTTNNVGIDYSGDAAGTASGNVIAFLSEGGSNRRGIEVTGNARPVINGNEIQDDPARDDRGLSVQVNAGVTVQVTNNVVRSSGQDVAMDLGINTFVPGPTINGNTFPTGVGSGFELSGTLTQSATIGVVQGQQSYRISFVGVQAPATLTIAPGITLSGQGNLMDIHAGAGLTAIGTSPAQRNVQFNNIHMRFFGPSSGMPAATGTLRHCMVIGPNASISLIDSSPTIEACTFSGISSAIEVSGNSQDAPAQPMLIGNLFADVSTGVQVSGRSQPVIADSEFDATSTGVALLGTGLSKLQGNRFYDNAVGVRIANEDATSVLDSNVFERTTSSLGFDTPAALFSAFPQMFDTSTFIGLVEENLVQLPFFSLSMNGTIPAAPVAYRTSGMTINQGTTLVVEPCTVFRASSSAQIVVNGHMVASGQPDCPITFSAERAKDGTRWQGLRWNDQAAGSASVLQSAVIEFAGSGGNAALELSHSEVDVTDTRITAGPGVGLEITNGSSPRLTGLVVAFNAGEGVRVSSGSRPQFERTSIVDNGGSFAMRNEDCATVRTPIDAEGIYWGADSGPLDTSDDRALQGLFNPTGAGGAVSDCIDYDPWIRIGPSIEGTLALVSGGGQSGAPGSLLPQPLVVEVRSAIGNPLANIDVTFAVAEGGGSIETPQPIRTGANGRASAQLRLGLTPGGNRVTVTARDVNSPLATFAAQGTGGASFAAVTVPSRPGLQSGDLDGDRRVDARDAIILERMLAGGAVPSAGDVNDDGLVDRGDQMLQLAAAARKPVSNDRSSRLVRAFLRSPAEFPVNGETFRVAVDFRTGPTDLAGYALKVEYDPSVLEIVAIDGGTARGFTDAPVIDRRSLGSGVTGFAAVNHGMRPTHLRTNVANIVVRAIGERGTRTRLALHGAGRAPAVLQGDQPRRAVHVPRALTLRIR